MSKRCRKTYMGEAEATLWLFVLIAAIYCWS